MRWGLFVGAKGTDLAPLDKPQPIDGQMDRLGGLVPQLRNVTAEIPELPRLDWEERSDWLNVKTKFGAVGDGKADDTAAIQAALDSLKDGFDQPNTVYLPPGTYRITQDAALAETLRQTHHRPRPRHPDRLGRRTAARRR